MKCTSILTFLYAITSMSGCLPGGADEISRTSDYIYVWAADQDKSESDFLAVVDANPHSDNYGQVLNTLPVNIVGTKPHHTEHVMPDNHLLFANGFNAGKVFVFDLTDPVRPSFAEVSTSSSPLTFPHSFERLPNGNVLSTFQTEGSGNTTVGGLVEFDPSGGFIRESSAADPSVNEPIRPYSLTILPSIDRVVSTSGDMRGEYPSRAIQIWRLSDLSLVQTILLPHGERGDEGMEVGEPRVLEDGKTVLIATFSCGLYRLTNIDSGSAQVDLVYSFPFEKAPECALPIRVGNYWIQTVPSINGLISLNISDPANPVEAHRLILGDNMWPHWLSLDQASNTRLVLTGYDGLQNRVVIIGFNPDDGTMQLDSNFGDPDSSVPGIDFGRSSWPHGETGPAVPHGVVFG